LYVKRISYHREARKDSRKLAESDIHMYNLHFHIYIYHREARKELRKLAELESSADQAFNLKMKTEDENEMKSLMKLKVRSHLFLLDTCIYSYLRV
jgi:mRNA-degrading endonuclease RelE of RelBE toxin-antitoxin system